MILYPKHEMDQFNSKVSDEMKYINCLEQLIKNVNFPTFVFDDSNKVILTNSVENAAYNWLGESPMGKTFFDLFPSEQANLFHDSSQNAMESKGPSAHLVHLMTSTGLNEIAAQMIPIFNPDSKSWNLICVIENKSATGLESVTEKTIIKDISKKKRGKPSVGDEVEEAKAALRFLLKEGAAQLAELKEEMFNKLANQILPHVEALKDGRLNPEQQVYAELLESNVRKLANPLARRISDPMYRLSPNEIKIAGLIRDGKTNKEMGKIMRRSKSTILTHRHHIRVKLGLKKKKVNLRSYLRSFMMQSSQMQSKLFTKPRTEQEEDIPSPGMDNK